MSPPLDAVTHLLATAALPLADGAIVTAAEQAAQDGSGTGLFTRLRGLFGVALLALGAWAISINRKKIPWRIVLWGLALQFIFALFILRTPFGSGIFDTANDVILAAVGFTLEGASFLFGDLVWNNVPVGTGEPGNSGFVAEGQQVARTGAFFAFNVLPTIIFFASIMTVLYHLGIMQRVVGGIAWVMQRTMRTSGAETLSAAGNIFVGQTEAPLPGQTLRGPHDAIRADGGHDRRLRHGGGRRDGRLRGDAGGVLPRDRGAPYGRVRHVRAGPPWSWPS